MKPISGLKISPWPWSHDVNEDEQCMVYDAEGHEIAQVFANDCDARIMDAAPEMYEALAAMLHCAEKEAPYTDMSHMDIAMDMARKALAKAAGEEESK